MPTAEHSPPSILFIAGDVSGDVHSAALAGLLLARDPRRSIHSLGGPRLREVVARSPGGKFLGDTSNCSAIGITSAVKIYFRCRRLRATLLRFLDSHHVDVVVLCDWGAFNGRLLPELHARGLPCLYYFPPRSWQRTGPEGLGIARYVRRVATPFEWSAERLRAAGCAAEWVGHAAIEKVQGEEERAASRQRFGVAPDETLIALLPSSRRSELEVIGPRMAETAGILLQERSLRFIAVLPRELAAEGRAYLPGWIEIVSDCATELLHAADGAIVKTGTASLEAVIAGTPHVAIYDASLVGRAEWYLLWAWKRIPFLAMPNIILQREAVPEFIGIRCISADIAAALRRLLDDDGARAKMRGDYALIREALGSRLPVRPTERTAQIVEEMLRQSVAALFRKRRRASFRASLPRKPCASRFSSATSCRTCCSAPVRVRFGCCRLIGRSCSAEARVRSPIVCCESAVALRSQISGSPSVRRNQSPSSAR
jgi:lipid-A-disaccharide synthase